MAAWPNVQKLHSQSIVIHVLWVTELTNLDSCSDTDHSRPWADTGERRHAGEMSGRVREKGSRGSWVTVHWVSLSLQASMCVKDLNLRMDMAHVDAAIWAWNLMNGEALAAAHPCRWYFCSFGHSLRNGQSPPNGWEMSICSLWFVSGLWGEDE